MYPLASVDTLKFKYLHLAGNTSKRHCTDGPYSDKSFHQSQRVARQQDRTRRRKRFHPLRDVRWDTIYAKVDEAFSLVLDGYDNRTRIDSDPDFKKHPKLTPNFMCLNARCFLHVERGVARSNRMIFESDGRAKAGHDAVTLFSGNALVEVNDVDHSVDSWFQNPASVLRIAVSNQRCGASDVGEENGYNFPFTFLRASNPVDKILRRSDLGRMVGCRL
jgi:hypothetical protein